MAITIPAWRKLNQVVHHVQVRYGKYLAFSHLVSPPSLADIVINNRLRSHLQTQLFRQPFLSTGIGASDVTYCPTLVVPVS